MATRVRRRSQAQRLALLEREHRNALDKMALAMFGTANRSEVKFRTDENKKAQLQAAGVTRSGRRSGASGRKSRTRIAVKEEQRRAAEQQAEAYVRANPDSPVARAWRRRTQEIDELRSATERSPEAVFGGGSSSSGRVHVKAYCVKAHTRKVRVRVAA